MSTLIPQSSATNPDWLIPRIEYIPSDLKAIPAGVWKAEPRVGQPGKFNKAPRHPKGYKLSVRQPETFVTLAEAIIGYSKGDFTGIGILLKGEQLVGIDIDDYEEAFKANPKLRKWFEHLLRSENPPYVEYSPSRKGLRIFLRGKLPSKGRKFGSLEIYDDVRFLTVTGHVYPGLTSAPKELPYRQDIVDEFLTLFPSKAAGQPSGKSTGSPGVADPDIVKAIAESVSVIMPKQWAGDWRNAGRNYPSQSESDYAVLGQLLKQAVLAGVSEDDLQPTILEAFKLSGAYTPDRERKAVNHGIPSLIAEWKAAPKLDPITAALTGRPERSTAVAALRIPEVSRAAITLPIISQFQIDPTDSGNATWLHRWLGGRIRWVYELNHWLYFEEGGGWIHKTEAEMARLCELGIRNLGAVGITQIPQEDMKRFAAHIQRSLNAKLLMNALSLLRGQPEVQIRVSELDSDDMLLGLRGGLVLDLRTGLVRNQLPSDLITKTVGCEYEPAAQCPLFDAFLISIFSGNRDLIDFLQRWVGYLLTGLTKEQQVLFAYGLGANGKSVLFSILAALLDDYVVSAPMETFMYRSGEAAKSYLIARLAGARFVLANETEDGHRLAESLIKELTGGETIAAAHKYGHPFEFKPKFKVAIVGNHKPIVKGTDTGFWRRIQMLPFSRTFTPTEQDPDLTMKLKGELSGILNWAIKGCEMWQKEGRISMPPIMRDEVEKYRSESDLIGQWIDENCIVSTGEQTRASDLFLSYRNWCDANGHRPGSQTTLGRRLSERGFLKDKGSTVTWSGIGLKQRTIL